METLSKLNFEHWWKLVAATGALIAIGSTPVIFAPGVLMGLGLLAIGVGEWINRPIQMKREGGAITESYPWRFYLTGVLLDVIGAGLFAVGLYKLLAFGP